MGFQTHSFHPFPFSLVPRITAALCNYYSELIRTSYGGTINRDTEIEKKKINLKEMIVNVDDNNTTYVISRSIILIVLFTLLLESDVDHT